MADQEINAKVLEIIGWKPQQICLNEETEVFGRLCNALGECEYSRTDRDSTTGEVFCICSCEESPPDFFAPNANPMMLLMECKKRGWNVRIYLDKEFIEVALGHVEGICFCADILQNCPDWDYLAAALARAIVQMEAKK